MYVCVCVCIGIECTEDDSIVGEGECKIPSLINSYVDTICGYGQAM
jgi:hypothetical protein